LVREFWSWLKKLADFPASFYYSTPGGEENKFSSSSFAVAPEVEYVKIN